MQAKGVLICCVVSAALGGLAVYKNIGAVETVREVVKDRIVTVTHTVIKPGGETVVDTVKHEAIDASSAKTVPRQDWAVGLAYGTGLNYGLSVDRRILGNLWITASATQAKVGAIGLKYEF